MNKNIVSEYVNKKTSGSNKVAEDNKFPLESFNLKAIKLSVEKSASKFFNCPINLEDITPKSNTWTKDPFSFSYSQDISSKLNMPLFKALFCRVKFSFDLDTGNTDATIGVAYDHFSTGQNGTNLVDLVLDHTGKVIDSKIYK